MVEVYMFKIVHLFMDLTWLLLIIQVMNGVEDWVLYKIQMGYLKTVHFIIIKLK